MSMEDTIISSLIHERSRLIRGWGRDTNENRKIERYGRKMLRFAETGRIRPTDSNEDIAAALTSGVWVWLFWQIAPDLLMWIVQAIRKRIWEQGPVGER